MAVKELPIVPRRKKGDDKPPRVDGAAKIDLEILRKAKSVAAYRGIHLAEYLSEKLRDPVTKDFEGLGRRPKGD